MMVENNQSLEKEKSGYFFDEEEEEIEAIQQKPTKPLEGILKPKDQMIVWQSYEKDRMSKILIVVLFSFSNMLKMYIIN